MKFKTSKNLVEYASKVLDNEKVSIRNFLKLSFILSTDNKWIEGIQHFLNIFLVLFLYFTSSFIFERMSITVSFSIKIFTGVSILFFSGLLLYIFKLTVLYRTLKSYGVSINEFSHLKNSIPDPNFYAFKALELTDFLFSSKTQEIFEQTVGDWQEDYIIAKIDGKDLKLWIINLRCIYSFLCNYSGSPRLVKIKDSL